jgi:hypothetical protein
MGQGCRTGADRKIGAAPISVLSASQLSAPYRSGRSRDWISEEPGQPGDDPGARGRPVMTYRLRESRAFGRGKSGRQSDPLPANFQQFAFRRSQRLVTEFVDFVCRDPSPAQRLGHMVYNAKIISGTGKPHDDFWMFSSHAAPPHSATTCPPIRSDELPNSRLITVPSLGRAWSARSAAWSVPTCG